MPDMKPPDCPSPFRMKCPICYTHFLYVTTLARHLFLEHKQFAGELVVDLWNETKKEQRYG
jgi:hypothetical protein